MGRGGADSATGATTENTSGEDAELHTNSAGESHCYNCGYIDRYWAHECPDQDAEQQAQLHINIGTQDKGKDKEMDEASLLLQFAMVQGSKNKDLLDKNQASGNYQRRFH